MSVVLRALPIAFVGILLAVVSCAQDELAKVQAGDELHEPVAQHAVSPVPQFDPASFPGQLFWLAIIFALLYLTMSRLVLPKIGTMIDSRAAQISRDLSQAQEDRTLAGALLDAHESRLVRTRVAAQGAAAQAHAEAARLQADELHTQAQRLAEAQQAAEARIEASRVAALKELTPAAALATQAIVTKLTGIAVDRTRAQDEVDTLVVQSLQSRKGAG